MGIVLEGPWPQEWFDKATVIATGLVQAAGGDLDVARGQLLTMIPALVMPGQPDDITAALADQVLAQPQIQALRAMTGSQTSRPSVADAVAVTLVVDAAGGGDFTSLREAVVAAEPGSRIMVRPGDYREGIVLNKPVDIVGDGDRDRIVVSASGENVVLSRVDGARVANLTLRQTGGGQCPSVLVFRGSIVLEACDISGSSTAGVAVPSGGCPTVRGNRIHDNEGFGVNVSDSGAGVFEDNDIFANTTAGVVVAKGGCPTVRGNRIHDNEGFGVNVSDSGAGVFEDNDIFANTTAGVVVAKGGCPTVRGNRIHDNEGFGVNVSDSGAGVFEDNDIFANTTAGVVVAKGGCPTVRGNRIHDNEGFGVNVSDSGAGVFEDNDIFANTTAGVVVAKGGCPTVRGNRIHDNEGFGVNVSDSGAGVFEDNDIFANPAGALTVQPGCSPTLRNNRVS